MKLTEDQIEWCIAHTKMEIMARFDISRATVSRWMKINDFKTKRQIGSGLSNSRSIELTACLKCGKHTKRKYCSRSCSYSCEIRRAKLRNVDKSYMLTEEYSASTRKEHTPAFKRYGGLVRRATEKVYIANLDIINPNSYTRTRCGVEDGYQLDHIVPVKFGFANNIPIEEMSRVENLRMLPWKQNLERNWKD
tara:strand:- start:73 stop:651 length:579 start_codon:yes stop_codon:yes gene_type:complete